MNFSSWDWWDTFRLHEAACLIAGVPVGPNRAPELEKIPADARPVLKRLISAYFQGQDYLKLPEMIGCPPAKILIGLPRDGTEAITEFLVSREELHRWIQAMGFKSIYQFLPLGADAELAPLVAVVASGGDKAWIEKARQRACQIIKRDGLKDLYPSRVNIADEVAREFRRDGVMGTAGKPLTGAYIKRHALEGISSAQGKQSSTAISRSK